MKRIILYILLFPIILNAQKKTNSNSHNSPKLIVGIVIDQMRYDYIYRFWDKFEEDGFKRLINNGFLCRNANFSYAPTFTGPGHASIFTGTTPAIHGIIANNWFDKESKKSIYCAGDGEMQTVCNCHDQTIDILSDDGKMSPHHMLSSTIADQMKLFNENTKAIGISLKDRGAILASGHSANAAYWMDNEGKWITSSYYMDKLPKWLVDYQSTTTATDWLNGNWVVKNKFNHDLEKALEEKGPKAIKTTPYGNTILNELAIKIIEKERLGKNGNTDFLSISFSSTDYIGHKYGPHSAEIEDTYIKLDKDLAKLLKVIDKNIGLNNAIIFLTADHGVVSEPHELTKRKIPAGYFDKTSCQQSLEAALRSKYGNGDWIHNFSNGQFFLNHNLINENGISIREIQDFCADFLIKIKGIKHTFTAKQMTENSYNGSSVHALIQRGFSQKRSGDVIIVLDIGWIGDGWESGGTTHGSSFSYDTHVPLVFSGKFIPKGKLDKLVYIQDIAPTISTLLGISYPNGCTGIPIREITEWKH